MKTLMLLAMLQVAPQDTVVVRVPIPQPTGEPDTTVVYVDVQVEAASDSIVAGVVRAQLALNEAIERCDCGGGGAPTWCRGPARTTRVQFWRRRRAFEGRRGLARVLQ